MFKYLPLILLLAFGSQMQAQKFKNPKTYFKKFQLESKKLRVKNFKYLKSSLKSDKPKKVDKFRLAVIEQAKTSKRIIDRLGPYQEYDILRKEYLRSMDMFIHAFENNFGVADELSKNRYKSYEDLKKYYKAVEKAESEMLEASFRIEAAEEHFAKKYNLEIVKNEELETQYTQLDEVTLYSRDMTLSYFRMDAEVRKYLAIVNRGNMDSLPEVVTDIRLAVRESKTEVEEYQAFDGETDLYDQMVEYIEEIEVELNENLDELTDNLQNEFMDEDEYSEVQKNLRKFGKRHQFRVTEFFEVKVDLIESYLPEK